MKLNKPNNINYCVTVIDIKNIQPLEGCDNVVATQIMGNQVIVGKDTSIGEIGLFFPVECALSTKYANVNNLFRKAELNADIVKKGYLEETGRVKALKFRGYKSEGLFMPLDSLISFATKSELTSLEIGSSFDELNGVEICKKYVVRTNRTPGEPGSRTNNKSVRTSKLVDNQFRFHIDTAQLGKNLHKLQPTDIVSISSKWHGTSSISSYVLCKKPLKWHEKLLQKLGVQIVDQRYDYIWSSRKVVKNDDMSSMDNSFYKEDIWGMAHKELEPYLEKGMTIYFEIVGYLPNGSEIQSNYTYGCDSGKHQNYIYRITTTNVDGKVVEWSAKMVQDWCKAKGLIPVHEYFYGRAENFLPYDGGDLEVWRNNFLNKVKLLYNDHDCQFCKVKGLPEEGVVIRVEGLDIEVYKQKSFLFLQRESKQLDKGEADIESEN